MPNDGRARLRRAASPLKTGTRIIGLEFGDGNGLVCRLAGLIQTSSGLSAVSKPNFRL
jgi:hypothetical protein